MDRLSPPSGPPRRLQCPRPLAADTDASRAASAATSAATQTTDGWLPSGHTGTAPTELGNALRRSGLYRRTMSAEAIAKRMEPKRLVDRTVPNGDLNAPTVILQEYEAQGPAVAHLQAAVKDLLQKPAPSVAPTGDSPTITLKPPSISAVEKALPPQRPSLLRRAIYAARCIGNSLLSIIGRGDDTIPLEAPLAHVNALEPRMRAMSDADLQGMTAQFKTRIAAGEPLDAIMPEAYAVVREASRRVLGMRPFDVQVMGAIAMHQGKVAEMRTGEGKTLAATLPVYLNALSGKGVHVVTVNQTLAERDGQNMGKLYNWLGLTVGVVPDNFLKADEKRAAYNADVTYVTNYSLGFDYLRDHMTRSPQDKVCREPHFALVDEVDEILIDEARTPLILSQLEQPSTRDFERFAHLVSSLKPGEDYQVDYARRVVWTTDGGLDKVEKHLGIDNLYRDENQPLIRYLNAALTARALFQRDKDYMVLNGRIEIIDEFTGRVMNGRRYSDGIHQALEAKEGVPVQAEQRTRASITYPNLFRRYARLAGMSGTAKTEESEFQSLYGMSVAVIPPNRPSRRIDRPDMLYGSHQEKFDAIADHVQKLYDEGKPVLIGTRNVAANEYLHQLLDARGIPHQLLNARSVQENTAAENEIVARAGKSGMVTLATNMAGRGVDIKPDLVNFKRLTQEIVKAVQAGKRAVVVLPSEKEVEDARLWLGVNQLSVAAVEQRSSAVAGKACLAQVQLVVDDGTPIGEVPGAVVLHASDLAYDTGGLHIVGTERHESRRIDNQLKGRSGRQGTPGETQFFISLEDELLRVFAGDKVKKWSQVGAHGVQDPMIDWVVGQAQQRIEGSHFEVRKQTTRYDSVLSEQRELYYDDRDHVVEGFDVASLIPDWTHDGIDEVLKDEGVGRHIYGDKAEAVWSRVKTRLGLDDSFRPPCLNDDGFVDVGALRAQVEQAVQARLEARHKQFVHDALNTHLDDMGQLAAGVGQANVEGVATRPPGQDAANADRLNAVRREVTDGVANLVGSVKQQLSPEREMLGERLWQGALREVTLDAMDDAWYVHLDNLQELQRGIGNVAYGQQDPWLAYQGRAFELWNGMRSAVEARVINTVMRG